MYIHIHTLSVHDASRAQGGREQHGAGELEGRLARGIDYYIYIYRHIYIYIERERETITYRLLHIVYT